MADNQLILGDRTYSFGTLPATDALRVETSVARVIGEPLFKAFTESKSGLSKDEVEKAASAAIGLLASRLDADDLIRTLELVFTKSVTVNGQRISSVDAAFTGRPREIWQVFIAALKFNFKDFFPEGLLTSVPRAS